MKSVTLCAVPYLLAAMLAVVASPEPSAVVPSPDATRAEAFVRFLAGREALAAQQWSEAEAAFRAATRLEPGLALAHYGLGEALMGQTRYPAAADAFAACRDAYRELAAQGGERARDMEIRDLRDTLAALAGRHALTSDRFLEMQLEKRLAELQKWGRRGTPWVPPGVTLALGTAYFKGGDLVGAEREFLAVLRDDPKSGDAENDLAVVYMLTGRLAEAEQAVKRAEKAGVEVAPRLKEEIRRRRRR
jgi:tetratricopeptide (TPR) repeat protein